jgi:hypothetical protein
MCKCTASKTSRLGCRGESEGIGNADGDGVLRGGGAAAGPGQTPGSKKVEMRPGQSRAVIGQALAARAKELTILYIFLVLLSEAL